MGEPSPKSRAKLETKAENQVPQVVAEKDPIRRRKARLKTSKPEIKMDCPIQLAAPSPTKEMLSKDLLDTQQILGRTPLSRRSSSIRGETA